jgi:hypothetical protein
LAQNAPGLFFFHDNANGFLNWNFPSLLFFTSLVHYYYPPWRNGCIRYIHPPPSPNYLCYVREEKDLSLV